MIIGAFPNPKRGSTEETPIDRPIRINIQRIRVRNVVRLDSGRSGDFLRESWNVMEGVLLLGGGGMFGISLP